MKKYIILIAVVALVIVVGVSVAINKKGTSTEEVSLKKIRLNEVTRSVFYAPQYVAISQGMFEKEGLEIELSTGQGADKVMTAVLARSK